MSYAAYENLVKDARRKPALWRLVLGIVTTILLTLVWLALLVLLLALFSALGLRDINLMNGLKNGMSFVLSGASVVTFALAGIVVWPQAALMMVAATLGGYSGAIVARRLSTGTVRTIVVCIGIVMTVVFTVRTI